jgi:SAM-dependent methyltransferase
LADDAGTLADPDLVREQYSDQTRLASRQALWRLLPGTPLVETVLEVAALRGTEAVLDIGCGNGVYLAALRRKGHTGPVLGLDLSVAMTRVAASHADVAVADVQALPVRTAAVDTAMSLHVLYHVPDLDAAAAEIRRVVRPGGCAVIATNGTGHTREVKQILAVAADRVAGVRPAPDGDAGRFGTPRARELFGAVFDSVTAIDAGGRFPVRDPNVVGDYLASWSPASIGLRSGPEWDAVVAEARALIRARVAEQGSFVVTSRATVLRCT